MVWSICVDNFTDAYQTRVALRTVRETWQAPSLLNSLIESGQAKLLASMLYVKSFILSTTLPTLLGYVDMRSSVVSRTALITVAAIVTETTQTEK